VQTKTLRAKITARNGKATSTEMSPHFSHFSLSMAPGIRQALRLGRLPGCRECTDGKIAKSRATQFPESTLLRAAVGRIQGLERPSRPITSCKSSQTLRLSSGFRRR
jgi:hypothetical protein